MIGQQLQARRERARKVGRRVYVKLWSRGLYALDGRGVGRGGRISFA
jgi:hypothetical protein